MTIHLRPLRMNSVFTCDWGRCDAEAVAERLGEDDWLSVCERHTGRRERRPSPGRAGCPHCGGEYTLSVAGKLRAHDAPRSYERFSSYERCPGSGREPEGRPS